MTTKHTIKALAVSGLLIGGLALGSNVFAQSDVSFSNNLIDRITEHFDLDTSEVDSFMSELKEERQAEMKARMGERLSEEVTEGNITEEQKQLIIEKREEIHAQMEQQREDLQEWADTNGIDLNYLHMGGSRENHGMRGPAEYVHDEIEKVRS